MTLELNPNNVDASETVVDMWYCNYRGDVGFRSVIPKRIWYGMTKYHPERGWLLTAFDLGKGAERDFALKDCAFVSAPNGDQHE